MDRYEDASAEHQRRRWMRPNAHLYIRHDAHRFMPPGSPVHVGRDVVKYFWPEPRNRPSQISERRDGSANLSQESLRLERQQLLRLKSELAALRAETRFRRFLRALKAYDPNQPRVPAGSPEGGQWAGEGGSGRVRTSRRQTSRGLVLTQWLPLLRKLPSGQSRRFAATKVCWICLAAELAPSPIRSSMAKIFLDPIRPRRRTPATIETPQSVCVTSFWENIQIF